MKVTFVGREEMVPGTWTFYFKPPRTARYIAGQFIELYLPHDHDERGYKRWFTLSSSPTEPFLAITTGFSTEGSSFKKQLLALEPGTELIMAEPMGDFVLPKDTSIPLVFVVAGLGVTPARSMVQWLVDTGEQRHVDIIHLARGAEQLVFASLFKSYAASYLAVHHSFDRQQVVRLASQDARSLIFIAGPEQFVEALYKDLQADGIPADRLIADYFPGYSH